MDEELKRYLNLMEDVKRRIGTVEKVVLQGWSLGSESADYEVVCINLRKILEIIAFAAMVANKAVYEKRHVRFASHWKAKAILEEMEKLNPAFYPVPFGSKSVGLPSTSQHSTTVP